MPTSTFKPIGVIVLMIILIVVGIWVQAWCWDYSISFWLHWAGKPDVFCMWHGAILTIVPGIGQCAIPVAGATFIASFFVDCNTQQSHTKTIGSG